MEAISDKCSILLQGSRVVVKDIKKLYKICQWYQNPESTSPNHVRNCCHHNLVSAGTAPYTL